MSAIFIEIPIPNNYKFTKRNMYNTFMKEISKIAEKEINPNLIFLDYKEKCCVFIDCEIIEYEHYRTVESTNYKLILKPEPKMKPPLFNIFIFNKK